MVKLVRITDGNVISLHLPIAIIFTDETFGCFDLEWIQIHQLFSKAEVKVRLLEVATVRLKV